jgi:transposase
MNAYSEDLRKKIVEALGQGMGKSEAARTFSVSFSSVKRYAKLAEEGRSLAPKKRPGSKPKLDERSSKLLEEDLKERPFITLQQRCEYLRAVASVEVSRSTMCRAIKRMNSTRKKGVDPPQNATSS